MKDVLKKHLLSLCKLDSSDWTSWDYQEDVNRAALTEDWLENKTSYIYKVGVLTAIDSNKCDWAWAVIGTQRDKNSEVKIIGVIHFEQGENDDMGRVLKRASQLLKDIHPAFDPA